MRQIRFPHHISAPRETQSLWVSYSLILTLSVALWPTPSLSANMTELPVGTQVRVLEFSKISQGFYATKVEVTQADSALKGQTLWVPYKTTDPQLTFENPQVFNNPAPVTPVPAPSRAPVTKIKPAVSRQLTPAKTPPADLARIDSQISLASPSINTACIACSQSDQNYEPFRPRTSQNGIRAMAKSCEALIDQSGRMGAHGELLAEEISKSPFRDSFLQLNSSHNPLGSLCPKFASLDQQNKTRAWVLFFAALAQEEAGCQSNIIHRTRTKSGKILNPTQGYGYWALEYFQSKRQWRGQACRGDIKSINNQVACTVSIMHDMQLSRGLTLDAHSNHRKYWGPTHSHRIQRQITPHMRRMTSCF